MKKNETHQPVQRHQFIYLLTLVVTTVLSAVLSSCSEEDDVSLIFSGRYKISEYCYNGKVGREETSQLNHSKSVFYIVFSQGTFVGTLDEGSTIEGTFKVNSSTREIHFDRVSVRPNDSSSLATLITKIIKEATYYSGDCNVLQLHADGETFITLDSREEIINKI